MWVRVRAREGGATRPDPSPLAPAGVVSYGVGGVVGGEGMPRDNEMTQSTGRAIDISGPFFVYIKGRLLKRRLCNGDGETRGEASDAR